MRAVIQVASQASVAIHAITVSRFDTQGLVVLLGVTHADTIENAERLARKIWELRILDGELSAADVGAPVIVVSQFTLYADTSKGRRPSWSAAAPADLAEPLVISFCDALIKLGADVQTGVFGEHMAVSLVNDGPRTLILDTAT
jgi:D-aminoacyl-tRNA deacylase